MGAVIRPRHVLTPGLLIKVAPSRYDHREHVRVLCTSTYTYLHTYICIQEHVYEHCHRRLPRKRYQQLNMRFPSMQCKKKSTTLQAKVFVRQLSSTFLYSTSYKIDLILGAYIHAIFHGSFSAKKKL